MRRQGEDNRQPAQGSGKQLAITAAPEANKDKTSGGSHRGKPGQKKPLRPFATRNNLAEVTRGMDDGDLTQDGYLADEAEDEDISGHDSDSLGTPEGEEDVIESHHVDPVAQAIDEAATGRYRCSTCQDTFASRNKLHSHLRDSKHAGLKN